MAHPVGTRFVEAVAAQDDLAIASCFAPGMELRALLPSGLRERSGADAAALFIASWFSDSSELRLVDSRTDEVGDRLRIGYRFEGVEGGQPYIVEQNLYCVLAGDVIERADLVCSGFRPRISA